MKPFLILSSGEDGEGTSIGNDAFVRLSWGQERPAKGESKIPLSDPRITDVVLSTIWQDELENANYHSFVMMPEKLLVLLNEEGVAPEIRKSIMFRMLTEGGLPD